MRTQYIKNLVLLLGIFLSITTFAQKLDRTKSPLAGAAPKINIGNYSTFELSNGLKVILVENHKLPRVSFTLNLDIDPELEGESAGANKMAGELLSRGTLNRTKDVIDDEIDMIGATLSTSEVGIYAQVLTKHTNTLLEIMSDVLINPTFPQAELEKLKTQTLSGLAAQKEDPNTIAQHVADVVRFGSNHPYSELVTEETVKKITLEKCKSYYENYFKPNVAYLIIVGDVVEDDIKPILEQYFGKWKRGSVPKNRYETPSLPKGNTVVFVDKPGSVQSVIKVTYPIVYKSGNPDEVKADVMNTLLGGGAFSAYLIKNLREDKAYTYGAYSRLNKDKLIGYFEASASVKAPVTDSAVNQFLYEMKRISTEKATPENVELIKNFVAGSFGRSLENPQTIARFALNIAKYNLPSDYYQTYLSRLSAVNVDDILEMAKKYIKPENSYIVVVGDKQKEGDKMKVFSAKKSVDFLDMNGKATVDVKIKAAPVGVTAQTVMDMYVKAIGGKDNINKITNITTKQSMSMQGMVASIEKYWQAPNKYAQTLSVGGKVMSQQVFDGQKAMKITQGQTQEVTGKDLEDLKEETTMFVEVKAEPLGYKMNLLGIEPVNNADAYKVEFTSPSGKKKTNYYDVTSGLKIRTLSTTEAQGNVISTTVDFADYKDVEGIKMPHSVTQNFGGRQFSIQVTSIDFKTVISEEVFKLK